MRLPGGSANDEARSGGRGRVRRVSTSGVGARSGLREAGKVLLGRALPMHGRDRPLPPTLHVGGTVRDVIVGDHLLEVLVLSLDICLRFSTRANGDWWGVIAGGAIRPGWSSGSPVCAAGTGSLSRLPPHIAASSTSSASGRDEFNALRASEHQDATCRDRAVGPVTRGGDVAERMVEANGVEFCTEPFGDSADQAVLLIMGLGASMLWWEEGFCQMLVDVGRFVIRYDHRDTGRSVTYETGKPGYSGADLLADAVGVLDAHGIEAAHVVVSAGGALALLLALESPDRALSLVAISTTPATPGDRSLPGPTAAFGRFVSSATVDWSNTESIIECQVG